MPNGDMSDYPHIPTLVEAAQEAEDKIKELEKEQQNLINEINKLEEENNNLRELLMKKVIDFNK